MLSITFQGEGPDPDAIRKLKTTLTNMTFFYVRGSIVKCIPFDFGLAYLGMIDLSNSESTKRPNTILQLQKTIIQKKKKPQDVKYL